MSLHGQRAALAVATLLLLGTAPGALAAGADTINTCTGAVGTIVDDEQDVFHITALNEGGTNLTGHSTATVTFTPDDPDQIMYEGHETFAISETSNSRNFTTTTTSHVRVKGTDGTFLTIGEVAHLTVSSNGITVSFEKPTFICS